MWLRTIPLVAAVAAVTLTATACTSESAKPQTISGTITVAADLAKDVTPEHILFVVARPADAPPFGPPAAAKRLTNLSFPVQYTISQADVFFEGVTLKGKVNVFAKLDKDGNAGPPEPGDLEGEYPGNPVTVGATGIDIVVDKVH